jgi:hypothetical protein
MPDYFSARETLAKSFWERSSRRIPWVAGQCFGLEINEDLSDACRLSASDSAAGTSATVSAATNQE